MSDVPFQEFRYHSRDGLKLYGRKYRGDPNALPLVCLPGLTRSSRDFHHVATYLANEAKSTRTVVTLDYRGRGNSAYDDKWENYTIPIELDDVLDGIAAAGLPDFALLGTSRGGLIAMAMGAVRPAPAKAVILNDIGPVINPEGLMRLKVTLGAATQFPTREAVAAHLAHTLSSQFTVWKDEAWLEMADELYRKEENHWRANYDVKLLKTLEQFDPDSPPIPLWHLFNTLARKPLMIIRGANSDMLSSQTLEEMTNRHEGAVALTVPGEGHAPALKDASTQQAIAKFLDSVAHQ